MKLLWTITRRGCRTFWIREYTNGGENFGEVKKMLEEAAKVYVDLRQSRSITLRVNKQDLIRVKARAKRSNIPYQTLINLLISHYVEGKSQLTI